MQRYITLQPVFDMTKTVFAYEIYINSHINPSHTNTPIIADSRILVDIFNTIGIDKLTGRRPAIINFNEELLKSEIATLVPAKQLIVQIHQSVTIDSEILECCKKLKEKGYWLSVPFIKTESINIELYKLADIINIDSLDSDAREKVHLSKRVGKKNISLLSKKVETTTDFEHAKELGFSLFQGFFFNEPEVLSIMSIQPLKFNYLQLIRKINEPEINFDEISKIISRDVSLSYKLLRLVNSVAFGLANKVETIKHAVVTLGSSELRKWITLLAIDGMNKDKPDEIIRHSLLRAKFGENICVKTNLKSRSQDVFLTGLFSMLDVYMSRPMLELLDGIKISDDIKNAIIDKSGPLSMIYNMVLNYETCNWSELERILNIINFKEELLVSSYIDATLWCNEIMHESIYILE